MSKILISGGYGFIGSWLTERLLNDGHEVTVVDNLSSNPIPYGELLEEWGQPKNLTFRLMDIAYFKGQGFDQIYHLASPVGPAGVLQYAGQMVRMVTDGAYAVMRMARECGAKLVFVSTSEVYGGGVNGLCAETMPKIIQAETTVRLEYAVAKLAAETALINTCRTRDLQACIIRPFNVAGPRQSGKGGFVLPRFIEQATTGAPLTIFGTGQQVRAFTHVKDIVDGLLLAMQKGRSGEAYNLGNPANQTTILDLAKQVIETVGSSSEYAFMDGKKIYGLLWADASDKYPAAEKAAQELGWQPTLGIRETILDTLAYQQQRMVVEP